MAVEASPIPTRFPCWCRAIYSWGGETDRDLGFVEGDLIECLNPGDGAWWTGRLRRDRRMVGVFPSNFVKVLDEEHSPTARKNTRSSVSNGTISSPPSSGSVSTPSPAPAKSPKKQSVFRKPFQSYKEAVGPSEALNAHRKAEELLMRQTVEDTNSDNGADPALRRSASPQRQQARPLSRGALRSPRPPSVAESRRSPAPRPHSSRSHSRLSQNVDLDPVRRQTPVQSRPRSRACAIDDNPQILRPQVPSSSPSPTMRAYTPSPVRRPLTSRNSSIYQPSYASSSQYPVTHDDPTLDDKPPSPEPPPPPPHRVAYTNARSPQPESLTPGRTSYSSEEPGTPLTSGRTTPSPVSDAMAGVLSSLHDMGLPQNEEPPTARRSNQSPYKAYTPTPPASTRIDTPSVAERARTSDHDRGPKKQYHGFSPEFPLQQNNYVQRMEGRLKQLHAQDTPPLSDTSDGSFRQPPDRPIQPDMPYNDTQHEALGRTATTKSSSTNGSSVSTGPMSQPSVMSGASLGAFSATSAGSFYNHNKMQSLSAIGDRATAADHRAAALGALDSQDETDTRAGTPGTSRNTSRRARGASIVERSQSTKEPSLEPLTETPKPSKRKSGFLKKIFESAKTSARSSFISTGSISPSKSGRMSVMSLSRPRSPKKETVGTMAAAGDWVQVRRDINRATTLGEVELSERAEYCQMNDYPVIYAIDDLREIAQGDEDVHGAPVEGPVNWSMVNMPSVDKATRFMDNLPSRMTAPMLANGYLCRTLQSDIQRLRAVFIWVAEKISWDEDIEEEVDVRRVIQMRRGSAREVSCLVADMCNALGIVCEVVEGYLKTPGEQLDLNCLSRPNHWWNTVVVENEWRIMDCSLANPTNPHRASFCNLQQPTAENWYFLARPMETCYTHIPLLADHQHICPPIPPEVLIALPGVCPGFFKLDLEFPAYDTSLTRLNGFDIAQIRINVPEDIECVAEVETSATISSSDSHYLDGDVVKKRALAQPSWVDEQKEYTIKGVLPSYENQGMLKVYAGKRGVMRSNKDIPHPLAFALPILYTGDNPPYDFVLRHPTPHAQLHDLYIVQPQCHRLAVNNTFIFTIRQHPSSLTSRPSTAQSEAPEDGRASVRSFFRPSSSLSTRSSGRESSLSMSSLSGTLSFSGGASLASSAGGGKPVKLAIQSPSGKITRLSRQIGSVPTMEKEKASGESTWETVIKISEPGAWRALVMADQTARWCVWAEWKCA